MKKILFLFMPLMLFAVAAIAQVSDPLNDALTNVGLSPTAISLISMGILIVGKLIPQKWTDPLVYVEKLFLALYLGVKKINDATNRLTSAQKIAKNVNDNKLKDLKYRGMLPVMTLLFIFILSSGIQLQAQSPSFNGFFKPVEVNTAVQKMNTRAVDDVSTQSEFVWLFRPMVSVTATSVNFQGGTAETKALSSLGTGLSLSKYITVDGKPYSQLSVNALFLTGITIDNVTSLSIGGAVTLGLFNGVLNFGGGYLDKGFVLLLGTSITL
jgi:hypothetical protein